MENQTIDCTVRELENKLLKVRMRLIMLRYYANQQLYQYRVDTRGVLITPQVKLAISIWKDIIRRLDE
jgi:hypothetical protein